MPIALLLSLIGIAALDSLNPTRFVAQFSLPATPRPAPRILAYIAGVLAVNVAGGALILGGLGTAITRALDALSGTLLHGLQLALGLACLIFGLWYRARAAAMGEARKPRSLRPIHAFALGAAVMLNEITALPYFIAIESSGSRRRG